MRYNGLLSVVLCFMLVLSFGCQKRSPESKILDEQRNRTRQVYKFNSWTPEEEELRRIGIRMNGLKIPGFKHVKTKFYSPVPGVTYEWKALKGSALIDITVKVCGSREEAFKEVIDYLTFGTNRHLEKTDEVLIGNVAFFDRKYPAIIFVRDNVKVLVHSTSKTKGGFHDTIKVASDIDEIIIASPIQTARRSLIKPEIIGVELMPPKIMVGRKSEIIVSTLMKKSKKLYYAFRASGGNILKGKEGKIYYLPTRAGKQQIEVFAGNEYNVVSKFKKEISVSKR